MKVLQKIGEFRILILGSTLFFLFFPGFLITFINRQKLSKDSIECSNFKVTNTTVEHTRTKRRMVISYYMDVSNDDRSMEIQTDALFFRKIDIDSNIHVCIQKGTLGLDILISYHLAKSDDWGN